MIITTEEIESFERVVNDSREIIESGHDFEELRIKEYLEQNPHLLLATYFDEYMPNVSLDMPRVLGSGKNAYSFFRKPGGRWVAIDNDYEKLSFLPRFWVEENLRALKATGGNFGVLIDLKDVENIEFSDLLSKLNELAGNPLEKSRFLISPVLWTPEAQREEGFY